MRPLALKWTMAGLILLGGCLLSNCKNDDNNHDNENYIWDIDKQGIPKFVADNYIDLSKIERISKFRSSVGHDYSDAYEQCRSMKHYFEPYAEIDWTAVTVYAPISGKITRVEQEWAGTKIEIESAKYPAFRFSIFHIAPANNYMIGDEVAAGQLLGHHASQQTYSDISVIVNDPTRQGRMVSFFDVMTDDLFNEFVARGASTRADFIISKAQREASPLTCSGDAFTGVDPLEGWFVLSTD